MKKLLVLIILLISSHAHAYCTPSHVIDGDTFVCDYQRIRIANIDAPELGQPEGQLAKAALASVLTHRQVELTPVGLDKYGRLVAHVNAGGINVGKFMLIKKLAVLSIKGVPDKQSLQLIQATDNDVPFEIPSYYRENQKTMRYTVPYVQPSRSVVIVKQPDYAPRVREQNVFEQFRSKRVMIYSPNQTYGPYIIQED